MTGEPKWSLRVPNVCDLHFRRLWMVSGPGQAWTGFDMCILVRQDLGMGWGPLSGRQRSLFWEGSDLLLLHCPLPSSEAPLSNISTGQRALLGKDRPVSPEATASKLSYYL